MAGGRLWAFSLAIYGQPAVAGACLSLQEARGLDVNLLLHALWCGALGHRITLPERARLDAAAAPWHDNAVRGLRAVRRWLKSQEVLPGPDAEALREAIKAQELEAERLEQELLGFLGQRLAKYKLPRTIEFSEEPLPKTGTGKIRKLVLKEKFWAGTAKRVQG